VKLSRRVCVNFFYVTVKLIGLDEVPKTRRKRVSRIKKTRDWTETIHNIQAGNFTAMMVEFSPETLSLGKAVPVRFRRMLAAELKDLGLASQLRLSFRGKSKTGAPILYVLRKQGMQIAPKRRRTDLSRDRAIP
jgi:hypothetical protein